VNAYTYSTVNLTYINKGGGAVQQTVQWLNLVLLLYKLGITVLY
jgi:hypothetical protein